MKTFALRKALEIRNMETFGSKEDLQKRLAVQVGKEILHDTNAELHKRREKWFSRRTLRGVGSNLGVSANYVNEEETKLTWDKFFDAATIFAFSSAISIVSLDTISPLVFFEVSP